MRSSELQAIYVMWLRQMKRFVRSRSRLFASIIQPLFFLVIFGAGLRSVSIPGIGNDYIVFIAPGIIAMGILFSSLFTGVAVLWDKQFGFLQEVLVAPIRRFTIIIGRTLGGATTALIQGFIVLLIALALGVKPVSIYGLLLVIIFMLLISFTAVGFGLAIACRMEDVQGFQLIMNLFVTPLFFLSSAFFPIATNPDIPDIIVTISYANPLFYMVDGMRGSLTGVENAALHPLVNLVIVFAFCLFMLYLGSHFFNKSEA